MVQRRRGGAENMANLLPLFLGIVLLVFGIASGSWRNVLIGIALACTVVVGFVGPRLVPPVPGISAERERARRAAAIILPNGIIYLALGILLRTAIPVSERGGSTLPIIIFAIAMGVLSILSGLGAAVRARRPDGTPAALPDEEHRGEI
ncbi:MAG: hypothetical protein ACR2M3_10050 [Thermomicrobiales bacterium]